MQIYQCFCWWISESYYEGPPAPKRVKLAEDIDTRPSPRVPLGKMNHQNAENSGSAIVVPGILAQVKKAIPLHNPEVKILDNFN